MVWVRCESDSPDHTGEDRGYFHHCQPHADANALAPTKRKIGKRMATPRMRLSEAVRVECGGISPVFRNPVFPRAFTHSLDDLLQRFVCAILLHMSIVLRRCGLLSSIGSAQLGGSAVALRLTGSPSRSFRRRFRGFGSPCCFLFLKK
jgi:hypothetical protein